MRMFSNNGGSQAAIQSDRASITDYEDAIDAAIVGMLADPKEGNMRRVSKGAPEQDVPEGRKESLEGPWQFVGIMPLFDPPRHDSVDTIRRALDLRSKSQAYFYCVLYEPMARMTRSTLEI
ncbi:hypothetical protein CTI12_AA550100 [Artemisia annua]|uniref:Uncharacterized protein n=1 Tax=Artemisia annua TaxID=35608 RepID=A0A2U1KYB9_ARTAN|nr:hypothetical protein CTI12_AA550100 [Artemisia annua]